jgi:GAF domain-containing protein
MAPESAVPEEFLHLGAVLLSDHSLDEVLQHALRLASQSLPSVTEASISLTRDGTVFTSNATDLLAVKADQAQYDTDGPCVLAIRSAEQHHVRVPGDTEQWPEFSAVVVDAGLRSVLSTPLQTGEETIGALNLYSSSIEGFDPSEQRLATEFARHASILLGNAIAYSTTTALADDLQKALVTRETIGIATGLLMAERPRSRQDAFDVLRRASQRENRKLRDIADDLVRAAEERGTP